MKISKSKQELARIISENGGWREEAESAAQCVGGEVSFWHDTATKQRGEDWCGSYLGACYDIRLTGVKLPNWHQTILSRAEYLHLYPAPDADGWIEWNGGECPVEKGTLVDVRFKDGMEMVGAPAGQTPDHFPRNMTAWARSSAPGAIIAYRLHKPEQAKPEFCESVMRSIPEPTAKPTIEQLAADYRNAKDYAERKQREADDAKDGADARLKALELAGESLGLLVSPITAKQDQELSVAMAPPKAQNHIDDNSTEADLLRQALIDAATSLETIHVRSYGADSFLDSKEQMRSFAESRAKVAREALGLSVTPITTR